MSSPKITRRSLPPISRPATPQPPTEQAPAEPARRVPPIALAVASLYRAQGPEATARSAGQALFDLTLSDPNGYVGSLRRFGTLLHSRLLTPSGGPSQWTETMTLRLASESLVRSDPLLMAAALARLTTIALFTEGTLRATQED